MNEVAMTLEEIEINFGEDIAEECQEMVDGEIKEFSVATYEGIVVRCERGFWTTYYVSGENILEEALELDDGMEMEM